MEQDILELGRLLRLRGLNMACAESCTGGLVAAALTSVPGSSDWFLGSLVAYHNQIKARLLNVPEAFLLAHGAVSEPVVLEMARGARRAFGAEFSVAVSGIAGPGGGTPDKPVGTVWLAWAGPDRAEARRFLFAGGREDVRGQSVRQAVSGLLALVRRVCGT